MKILSQYGVGGVILGACAFLFPYTVGSLEPSSAPCQHSEGCFSQFLEQLQKKGEATKSPSAPARLLNQIVAHYGDMALAKRARFRYGHWLKESSPLEAIPLLQTSLLEYPVLGDYLTFWLGQAYLNAGLKKEAAEAFQRVNTHYSDSLLRSEALYAAGDVLATIGDCEKTVSVLSQALKVASDHSKAAEALYRVGLCADQLGKKEKARETFRELWWKFPLAQESIQAEEWLRKESGTGFLPTLAERYKRGMALYDGGVLEEAVQEFQGFVASSSPTPQVFDAQYKAAMALARLKRYDQAETILTALSRSSSSRADDAWVWLGRVYLRQGKGPQLETLVRTLPAEKLAGDQQSLLFTFYGVWLEDHSRWAEAGKAYETAAKVAQSLTQRVDALWRVGWLHYQRGQFTEAIQMFQKITKLVGRPDSDSALHAVSQARYWLARSQEHRGQKELARQCLRELRQDYPFTYYGQLAELRLGPTEFSTKSYAMVASHDSTGVVAPPHLQQDIHFQKIQALGDLQLFKEAVKELEGVYSRYGGDSQTFPQLVSLAGQIGAYDVGIRLAIRHFGMMLRTGRLPFSSPAWSGAFPIGYQMTIQSFAPEHVNPFLVAGLIREESLYSARVVSPVGAIGLMQLMPATAQKTARQLGLQSSEYDPQDLYEPEHNIQLGTYYLGQLLNEFQGNIIYAVAAYNAGPQAVQRWIAQNGERDPDEFVEFIGYRETRGYVKRVVGSYRIYQMLFGKACQGVSLDRFC